MNIFDQFSQINCKSATAASVFFLSLVAPGLLTIFYFDHDLLVNLEILKLVALSMALSAPGVFVPYMVTAIFISLLTHKKQIAPGQFGSGANWYQRHGISNAINIYLALLSSYAFSLTFKWFVWMFVASIAVSILFEIWILVKFARSPEKYVPIETY